MTQLTLGLRLPWASVWRHGGFIVTISRRCDQRAASGESIVTTARLFPGRLEITGLFLFLASNFRSLGSLFALLKQTDFAEVDLGSRRSALSCGCAATWAVLCV